MKRTYIIAVVWLAVIVCLISFGATVFFLEKENNKLVDNKNINNEQKSEYITNESSIRTARLEDNNQMKKDDESISTISNTTKNTKTDIALGADANENSAETVTNAESTATINNPSFVHPVKGEILIPLSLEELVYSKTLKEWKVHKGVDYKAQLGNEVYAVRNGKIKKVGFNEQYGKYIQIEHDDSYESFYTNITVLEALKEGDLVSQGQVIGYVAESFGFEAAEETHLHFELKKEGKYISI